MTASHPSLSWATEFGCAIEVVLNFVGSPSNCFNTTGSQPGHLADSDSLLSEITQFQPKDLRNLPVDPPSVLEVRIFRSDPILSRPRPPQPGELQCHHQRPRAAGQSGLGGQVVRRHGAQRADSHSATENAGSTC